MPEETSSSTNTANGSGTDYTERERIVRVEIEIPIYGSEVHLDTLRDRLKSVVGIKFPEARITDLDQTPREE